MNDIEASKLAHRKDLELARQFARDIMLAEVFYTRAAVCVARLFLELDAENEDLRAALVKAQPIVLNSRQPEGALMWRDPMDKPPHLQGEHHSQDVLLLMKKRGWIDEHRIAIGHVSLGHWRPRGGNGNFDDDVEGWMPLPDLPKPQVER